MQGWKTFSINAAVILVGAVTTIMQDAPISEDASALTMTILGGVNVVLRFLTTTPVFQKA